MKVILIASLILTLFALIFPPAASLAAGRGAPPPAEETDSGQHSAPPGDPQGAYLDTAREELPFYTPPEAVETSDYDTRVTVRLLADGQVEQISVRDYLIGAVAAEEPATFAPQALMAQAVALRSYLMRKMLDGSSRHPEADICGDSSCCAAYKTPAQLREKWGADYDARLAVIAAAVDSTAGIYLAYEGEPALALFHSSSAGRTESAGEVWSSPVPYLVSVASPEDESSVPNYISAVTVSAREFRDTVTENYPEASFGDNPAGWVGETVLSPSGRVSSVVLGGVEVPGTRLRSMFGLRSTAVEITVSASTVTMTCRGYGHGVGMSQYGANVMAGEGADFQEILAAYYPGTVLMTA